MKRLHIAALLSVAAFSDRAYAQSRKPPAVRDSNMAARKEWNAPQKPFKIFGNTWFVGTHGLSALLVTSPNGHALIDAGLPESAPLIAQNIAALGFRIQDVKLIVNSHVHYDHAGGIAELQKLSGARVVATPSTASVLKRGDSEDDDPQFGLTLPFPKVANVSTMKEGEIVKGGDVALTAHFTGGHTPGGTTWAWTSCEGARCVNLVYADSQTPISADDFYFTRSKTYPNGIRDFEHGFKALESMNCDILITPHPDASVLWQRVAKRDGGDANGLVDNMACKRYAAGARQRLATRIATENGKK